ncbi:MAG: hypothetical protein LWW83_06495 [Azonexaceae bacterium]|nr:hypothetical protein [Azonexaceae bacterium]
MWSVVLKLVGGSLLACALVWVLVLGWWQSNDYEPTRLDLALYLGALPFALIGGFLLLRGFIEHLKAPASPVAPTAPEPTDSDPLAIAAAKTSAAERLFKIRLVDAFAVTAAGDDPEAVLAAIEEGKRPEPSSSMMDEDGQPVFLAEVADLDTDDFVESLSDNASLAEVLHGREDVVRAMVLLGKVLQKAKDAVAEHWGSEALRLRIVWVIPESWQGINVGLLKTWLKRSYWPDVRDAMLAVDVISVASDFAVIRQFDEIVLRINRDVLDKELVLLAGAVSRVDENTVLSWEKRGRLFSANRLQQPVPGEVGVALLLAHETWLAGDLQEKGVVVSRMVGGTREKPIGSAGRIRGKLIEQLLAALLDVSGVTHGKIGAVLLDADHRTDYLTEALDGIAPTMEHLDPAKDWLAIGIPCGKLSPMAALTALACAKAKVLADDAPVLCLSSQHDVERALLLLSSATPLVNTESVGI